MDNAVALVQAYLNINGYFTVVEYPVVEASKGGRFHPATDLDILAVRFPGSGRYVPRRGKSRSGSLLISEPDHLLECMDDETDMIIGEVKVGQAHLNAGLHRYEVLEAALIRFGCCPAEHAEDVLRKLNKSGEARTVRGHRIRFVAFGSEGSPPRSGRYKVITLNHVVEYLDAYLDQYWEVMRTAQLHDSVLGLLATLKKAKQAREKERDHHQDGQQERQHDR